MWWLDDFDDFKELNRIALKVKIPLKVLKIEHKKRTDCRRQKPHRAVSNPNKDLVRNELTKQSIEQKNKENEREKKEKPVHYK